MNKNRKRILVSSIVVALTALISVTASYSWFLHENKISSDDEIRGINGDILSSYFHCGDGSFEDPFVITRPKHWENLIWLHNNVPYFYNANIAETEDEDGKGYYFEIGYAFDDSGIKKVYDYNDNGIPIEDASGNPTYSTTLNLKCYSKEGNELIPLGSPQNPFIGTLEGNGIKASGFTVSSVDRFNDGHILEDIGVFGYVGPNGKINNTYFSDFTIDTNGAEMNEKSAYPHHTSHNSQESNFKYPCIGYLAGHTYYSTSFTNVYVNNCSLAGTGTNEAAKLNTYGYFGVVEKGATGTNIGNGNDYSFRLESSAVYNYLSSRFDDIKNTDLYVRNTEYNSEINGQNKPFISAFENTDGVITGSNYNLMGDDPDYSAAPIYNGGTVGSNNSYQGRNYSLSTVGYYGAEYDTSISNYEVYALKNPLTTLTELNASGEDYMDYLKVPASDMEETTLPLNKYFNEAGDTTPDARYRFDEGNSNKFKYYEALNEKDYYDVTFEIASYSFTRDTLARYSSIFTTSNSNANLYIDGVGYDLGLQVVDNNGGERVRDHSYTLNFSKTPKVRLLSGDHSLLIVIRLNSNETVCRHFAMYWGGRSGGVSGSGGTYTQKTFSISPAAKKTRTYTFGVNSGTYDNGCQMTAEDLNGQRGVGDTNPFVDDDSAEPFYKKDTEETFLIGRYFDEKGNQKFTYLPDENLVNASHSDYDFKYTSPEEQEVYLAIDEGIISDSTTFNDVKEVVGALYKKDGESYVEIASYDSSIDIYYYKDFISDEGSWNVAITSKELVTKAVDTLIVDKTTFASELEVHEILYKKIVNESGTSYAPITSVDQYEKDTYYYYQVEGDVVVYPGGNDGEKAENTENEIVKSGYSYDNIDIVGGGVKFSQGYITFEGEDNRALVHPVTDSAYYGSDSGVGKQFYATKYCPNSIILYLKNVAGNNPDDIMGTIEFQYTWSVTIPGLEAKEPSFKKGNGNFVRFKNMSGYGETGYWTKTIKMELKRSDIQKAAYCALNDTGQILCGYDSNGNALGVDNIDTTSIDKYVLVVGVDNRINGVNTRITHIQFDYVAPRGFGGQFGTVEFRSQGFTTENSIINFIFICPENDKFKVSVIYNDATRHYDITFYYYSTTADAKLAVSVYLYDTSLYSITFNGSDCATRGYEQVNISSTAVNTWS